MWLPMKSQGPNVEPGIWKGETDTERWDGDSHLGTDRCEVTGLGHSRKEILKVTIGYLQAVVPSLSAGL